MDEAHNLPVENFMELLSEARKYRMGLVMATQYAAQLTGRDHGQDLLSAVLGNVGSLLFFRVGQQDAPSLGPMLQPRFSSLDLVNLPDRQGYSKLQLGSLNVQPFSFHTEKDQTRSSQARARQNRNYSRGKYGRPAAEVDEQIAARRKRVLELAE
ncbi:MAG: TraM recognition domain-containing protein [Desulfohalobiaceae bacterium]|nr:TraM recognition domain-containing protein [Desulfohalobiaceae bacterium]